MLKCKVKLSSERWVLYPPCSGAAGRCTWGQRWLLELKSDPGFVYFVKSLESWPILVQASSQQGLFSWVYPQPLLGPASLPARAPPGPFARVPGLLCGARCPCRPSCSSFRPPLRSTRDEWGSPPWTATSLCPSSGSVAQGQGVGRMSVLLRGWSGAHNTGGAGR